jgi:molybdopterin converting factor small subunit
MNEVRVLMFARARELADCEFMTIQLGDDAQVADLRELVAANAPALRTLLPRCAVSVNGQYAEESLAIPSGAEIAILPPVSGG